MQLVFATHNRHKFEEISLILGDTIKIVSLDQIGCNEEIPEPFNTLEENAQEKTRYVMGKYGYNCFSDDTGLEIMALKGEPGVFSARYASMNDYDFAKPQNFEANIQKVLFKLKGISNRQARFRTVIALIWSKTQYLFEGVVDGTILEQPIGNMGFGYDPIFMPLGYSKSFAQMSIKEKNLISHRAIAFKKLKEFLKTHY